MLLEVVKYVGVLSSLGAILLDEFIVWGVVTLLGVPPPLAVLSTQHTLNIFYILWYHFILFSIY